jgi:uncharacterized membrane protein (UPF0127 family)
MRLVTIVNRTRESVLGANVGVADSWWRRARGFLRRPEPREGEGLLLNPCRAVHMVGMSFSLDVVFVDRHGRVLALYPALAPGRRSGWHGAAKYAIELPVGTIEATRTEIGDLVAWQQQGATGGESSSTAGDKVGAGSDPVAESSETPAFDASESPRGAG